MTHNPYEGVYQDIDEQIGFPHQTSGHRPKQQLARRDISAAQRQAAIEAKARQRNLQGNKVPPDALPRVRQRPDREEDEYWYTHPPRNAVRNQPEEPYRHEDTQGNNSTSPPPINQRNAIPPDPTQSA